MLKKNGLVKNISSLFLMQLLNYVFPLVSVPIIVRIIGPDKFGIINYASAIVAYFVILINYGFDLTATRKIAQNPEDKKNTDEVFSLVLACKLVLFSVSSLLFICAFIFIPVFQQEWRLMIFSFMLCFAWVITPNWLYQAKQELHRTAMFNLVTKVGFTVVILLLIRQKSDYVYQPLAISIAQIVVGVYSFVFAIKKYKIDVKLPSFTRIFKELKDESLVFFSSVVINLYTTTTTVILGAFTTSLQVGYYTGATKLISIAQSLIAIPLAQSLFPFVGRSFGRSREEGIAMVRKIAPIVSIFTLLCGLGMILLGPFVIRMFYGRGFENSVGIFQLLSFVPFIVSISNIYGIQIMMNLKLDKAFFRITLIGSIVSLFFNFILVNYYGAVGSALTLLGTEILITVTMGLYLNSIGIQVFSLQSFKPSNILLTFKPLFKKA